MNILGEGFPKEIIDQISVRQKAYGSGYSNGISRTSDQIIYLNANTAWCKLVSSTDIDKISVLNNPTIKQLGLTGTELARQFVLFNGTADENGIGLRSGIDLTKSLSGNNNVYGIGGTDFGISPMMGIQNVSVTHENRGSLRQASVKIKAWNKAQLEIIDVLYLRLGFSVLLEWGNTMYYDNSGVLQTNPNNSLAYEFLDGKVSYNDFLKKIEKNRLNSLGNYDAMFAKVKNFHWSFQKDGSYDITLDLISSGDIIESLKINAIIEDPLSTEIKKEPKPDTTNDNELINFYAKKSSIGQFFYFLRYQLDEGEYSKTAKEFYPGFLGTGIGSTISKVFSFSDLPNTGIQQQNEAVVASNVSKEITKITNPNMAMLAWLSNKIFDTEFLEVQPLLTDFSPEMFRVDDENGNTLKITDAVRYPWDDKEGKDKTYYVRFGTFLAFIQNYLMPKCIAANNSSIPLLNVDYDQNTNLMYAYKWQVSADPRICLVGRTINIISGTVWDTWQDKSFGAGCDPFINEKFSDIAKGVEYGNIMNVYLNMVFILNKIDELKDDKNQVPLFDLVKAICDGINEGLGGINSLEPIIDESTNTLKIIDANPLPNNDQVIDKINNFYGKYFNISTELASFDLYGYNTSDPNDATYGGSGHASFVKDFSFTTEITPEYATMITVGAAANGSVVGANNTALSRLNVGLSDRYKKEILDIYEIKKRQQQQQVDIQNQISSSKSEADALKERYEKTLIDYFDWLEEMSDEPPELVAASEPTMNVDDVDAYKGVLTNIKQMEDQYYSKIYNLTLLNDGIDPNNPEQPSPFNKGTGFIPFNLSITTDGLSGMKIYSKFTIDVDFLPSNYPESVEFLIKSINHEISDNKWFTKLESICISKGKLEETQSQNITPKGQSSAAPTPTPPFAPNPISSPDWSKYNVGATPLLKNAVRDQSTYVYSKGIYAPMNGLKTPTGFGEIAGRCAGYTYNIAYKLKDYIKSNSTKAIQFAYHAAGDANSDTHRQNIVNLGMYDIYYLGDYKASELKNGFVSKFKWNYGDILNYYAPGYAPPHNMHSQIYTGDIWTKGISASGVSDAAGSQGWSTSGATNYGAQFVYKSNDLVFKVYAFKVKTEYLK